MRDKLAEVITAELPLVHLLVSDGHYQEASGKLADAIREYLGSDEVVTDAARAMATEINFSFDAFGESSRSKYLRQARAALSSIMEQSDGR